MDRPSDRGELALFLLHLGFEGIPSHCGNAPIVMVKCAKEAVFGYHIAPYTNVVKSSG